MKYFITSDKKIHQVTNVDEFLKWYPKAQDVTLLPNVYEVYCKQEEQDKDTKIKYIRVNECKKCGSITQVETDFEDCDYESFDILNDVRVMLAVRNGNLSTHKISNCEDCCDDEVKE